MAKEKPVPTIDIHGDALAAKEAAEKAGRLKEQGAAAVQVLTASLTVAAEKAAALTIEYEAAEKLRLAKAEASIQARRAELGIAVKEEPKPAPVPAPTEVTP